MAAQIIINEIHPNQESGSEWIELRLTDETASISLENFSIFDNTRQIYKFTNEQFVNQLLVVELSGLNNDTDSVVLKNAKNEILDSFTYEKSEKGLSWSRDELSHTFILTSPSRNLSNPIVTNSPTPTVVSLASPTPTPTPTPTPPLSTPTQTTINDQKPTNISNTNPLKTRSKTSNTKQIFKEYDLEKIKLNTIDKEIQKKQLRLVFIGEQVGQAEIVNAIIGSFLIILSALLLLYVKIKNKHP